MATPNPDRVKLTQPQLADLEAVNDALYQYGFLEAKIRQWKARCKMLVDGIKRFIKGKIDVQAGQKNLLAVQIDQYLRHNEADFTKPRSKQLTFGKIGWRKSPGKVDLTDEEEDRIIDLIVTRQIEPAYEAVEVCIIGTYKELKDICSLLKQTGRGDLPTGSLLKWGVKELPEEVLQELGIQLDGDEVPFFTTATDHIIETEGIAVKFEPMKELSLKNLSSAVAELKEDV